MKKIIIFSLVVLCTMSLSAQRFGIKGGLNLANFAGSETGNSRSLVGYNAGFLLEVPLTRDLFLQPEFGVSLKGAKYTGDDIKLMGIDIPEGVNASVSIKPLYLDFPVKLLYKFDVDNGKIGLAIGPYAGYAISGKATASASNDGSSIDYSIDIFKADEYGETLIKRFDAGAIGSLSYELNDGLFFSIDYERGLVNLNDNAKDFKNSAFSFKVGIKF